MHSRIKSPEKYAGIKTAGSNEPAVIGFGR